MYIYISGQEKKMTIFKPKLMQKTLEALPRCTTYYNGIFGTCKTSCTPVDEMLPPSLQRSYSGIQRVLDYRIMQQARDITLRTNSSFSQDCSRLLDCASPYSGTVTVVCDRRSDHTITLPSHAIQSNPLNTALASVCAEIFP